MYEQPLLGNYDGMMLCCVVSLYVVTLLLMLLFMLFFVVLDHSMPGSVVPLALFAFKLFRYMLQ